MAKDRRHRDTPKTAHGRRSVPQLDGTTNQKPTKRIYANIVVAVVALGSIIALATISTPNSSPASNHPQGIQHNPRPEFTPVSQTEAIETDQHKVETLKGLLQLTPEERAAVDIARANLLVAKSTPGAEDLDINAILQTLDEWAAAVATETDRHLYRFHANPGNYENSEGYFRILALITVLQRDYGVRYNPERITEPDFTNPGDLFIHGMVGGEGGTCVSMPVLYTAVARRLGYPVSLVTTKGHVFARWEDKSGERFNIEATNQGLTVHPDEYYKTWPLPITSDEIERFDFLDSLSADESLAMFLCSRGHALADTGQPHDAIRTYRIAAALDPGNAMYEGFVAQLAQVEFLNEQFERNGFDPIAELRRVREINSRNSERILPHQLPRAPMPYPRPEGP